MSGLAGMVVGLDDGSEVGEELGPLVGEELGLLVVGFDTGKVEGDIVGYDVGTLPHNEITSYFVF